MLDNNVLLHRMSSVFIHTQSQDILAILQERDEQAVLQHESQGGHVGKQQLRRDCLKTKSLEARTQPNDK